MKANKIAAYYGFQDAVSNVKDFGIIKQDKSKSRSIIDKHPNSLITDKISLIRMFVEKKMSTLSQPPMIYHNLVHSVDSKENTLCLDILNNPKSIAEAIIIETSYVISKDDNPSKEITLELNTLGDRESMQKLYKELSLFYKKNWSKVPKHLRVTYKKDLYTSFQATDPEALELRMQGPDPIRCLSEPSRKSFKEVLEYIEKMNIPYVINHSLLGDTSYGNETVFNLVTHDTNGNKQILAYGQRYNTVARRFLNKKEVPSIGVSILLKKEMAISLVKNEKEKTYKFFFIQLSFDAKLESLKILETLRKASVSTYQSLSRDKLASQISLAERMNVPYVIIMGKKEALEGNVLVRHMQTRRQDTVSVTELVSYVKKL